MEATALIGTIYDPPRSRGPWTLNEILPPGQTRYSSLGRWALVAALRACGVGSGDHVLVPGLICREVLASLHEVGARAAFYPVSRQLCATVDDNIDPPAKAALAVNYFGFAHDLGPFRRYCARTGAALIEDNAHGLFSGDADGRLLGLRGDAGIFSFRKTIAVPDGAAVVLSGSRAFADDGMLAHAAAPSRYRLKQTCRPLASVAGPRRMATIIESVRQVKRAVTGHAVPPAASDAETRIPTPPNPSRVITDPITVADPAAEVQRRRALYEVAAAVAQRSGATPVFPALPPNVVPYGFPMYVDPHRMDAVRATARRHGLQLAPWPDLPSAIRDRAPEHYRQLMVMPFLW
jgi:hypothetical protein